MKRYFFVVSAPFIDAENAQAAWSQAMHTKILSLREEPIPEKVIILCSVTPTPNNNNNYSARAYYKDECIATADAPSQQRALIALGLNNPSAHTCKIYKQRFGDNWELRLDSKPVAAQPNA